MTRPKQIRKQTEVVEQLYKDLNVEPVAPPSAEIVEIPAGDGGKVQDKDTLAVTSDAPQPVADEQQPTGSSSEDTYESKYRVLQGKYNAEVPRLTAEGKELGQRVEQLETLLSTLTTQVAEKATPQPEAVTLITEQDVEEYGDSINIMRKAAQEETAADKARIAALENTISQLQASVLPRVEQLANDHAQTTEQAFWAALDTTVPDWQAINNNQDFQSWLLEVDNLTGATRQAHLEDAQRSMDAARVASFFTTWKGSAGTPAPTERKVSEAELERQVAPGKGRSASAPTGGEAKTYSRADIASFFDDVRMGKYVGKEDERNRIESDIFAAQQDGRIT